MDMIVVAAGIVCGLLGLLGTALWIATEGRDLRGLGAARVPAQVYRLLQQAQRRLFWRDPPSVRFTIFVADAKGEELQPIARLGWGRSSTRSDVRFRKGRGLAGMAWEQPGAILVATTEGLKGEEHDRFQRHDLDVPKEIVQRISEDQRTARATIAIGLIENGRWFKGVLCIDSLADLARSTEDAEFWAELARFSTELAATLPAGRVEVSVKEVKDVDTDLPSVQQIEIRESREAAAAAC
jgi:hypothetical protein